MMKTIELPIQILSSTGLTEQELKQEIAIMLFQKEKLTLSQASKLAQQDLLQFQYTLASRKIPVHYDLEDFEKDLATLKDLGRL